MNKGSAYDSWARDLEAKIGWKVESFGTQTDAVQAVLAGRADANVAGNTVDRLGGEEQPAARAVLPALDRPGLGRAAAQGLRPSCARRSRTRSSA